MDRASTGRAEEALFAVKMAVAEEEEEAGILISTSSLSNAGHVSCHSPRLPGYVADGPARRSRIVACLIAWVRLSRYFDAVEDFRSGAVGDWRC